jgi:flagellar biosynthetic protein FliR/type III secretion protein T
MNTSQAFFTAFVPHLVGITLCALRILPITLLCPLLGGLALTSTVRLSVTLALAGSLHFNGATIPPDTAVELMTFVVAGGKELLLGTLLGFLSALPFDAARMAGRFIDTFRGASAEVALPLVGSREAITGELLHQLLLVGAVVSGAMGDFIRALWVSFAALPVGSWTDSALSVDLAIHAMSTAFALSFVIGAPVACVALLIDAGLAMAARLAPRMSIHELAPGLSLLAGAGLLFLAVDTLSGQLLSHLQAVPAHFSGLARSTP